jgi:hypothetical protein
MAEDFVFPEDEGTGATGGDNADAANFASLAFDKETRNAQISPVSLTPDFSNDTLDINSGLMLVSDDQANEAQTNSVRDQGVRYAVILSSRMALSIGSNRQEAVWISVDLSADDTVNVVIQKEPDAKDPASINPAPPEKPRLKIGVVDNDEQKVYLNNTEQEEHHKGGPIRDFIRLGESVEIPTDFQQIFIDSFEVDGKMIVDGKVKTI